MVETFTNSRAEEVRSLRLDVFYPHLNLIPETSHLSILVISRNSSEGRISSNRGSPRISHHLFKTLFRFPVPPRFPLKRSKKKERKKSSLPLTIFQLVSWITPLGWKWRCCRYVALRCIRSSMFPPRRLAAIYTARNREGEVSPWDMDNRSLMIVCNRRICGDRLISLHGASSATLSHRNAFIAPLPSRQDPSLYLVTNASSNNVTIICIEGQRVWISSRVDEQLCLHFPAFAYIDIFDDCNDISDVS